MTTSGRTYWMAKDAGWWRREGVVALGEEFGADGPAVLDWLSCEAKAQNDGGWVKTGFRSISRGSFVELVTVGHAVSRSVTLGLLDDYEEANGRFTCRISGWQADQERAHAAGRKAAQRARNAVNTGDDRAVVTVSHGQSRSVTECPPTGQDRTEEQQPPKPPASGGPSDDLDAARERLQALPPVKPTSGRKRDQDEYQQQLAVWVDANFPGCQPSAVEGLIGWVRSRGTDPTPAALRDFAEAAPNFSHVLEAAA